MPKTMLENLYHDALALTEKMRDYVRKDARRDREALAWADRAATIQANRLLTVGLCHALQLIQAHRARLAGSLEAGVPPRIGLSPVPVDSYGRALPERLKALCLDANHLFERLHAVHMAIQPSGEGIASDAPGGGRPTPPLAVLEADEVDGAGPAERACA